MKQIVTIILLSLSFISFAQDKDDALLLAEKNSNNYVADANDLAVNEDYISAEMEYRKALSEKSTSVAGAYNLGHSYYKKGNFEEALYRHQQAAKNAISKEEKHKAFHSIGNILMQNKACADAVEAFKSALRSNPKDDETRYNLALAKECAKKQEEENKNNKDEDEDSEDEEKKEQNQDQQDKEEEDQEKKEDQGDQDKKEGEDQKDEEGKPKEDEKDKGKEGENKDKPKPKPQPGQMSPQQIKNLLEDMENQEQKVQEKINAQKAKGAKVQTEKDW